MALPALLRDNLSIPVIGAPRFIVSSPDLVIEQCKAGVAEIVARLKAEYDAARAALFAGETVPTQLKQAAE